MNVARVLTKKTVVMELEGSTKEAVIRELIAVLAADGHIQDADDAMRVVMERERKMSTGLQSGIAIPHGKSESVESLVAALGIKHDGIPFESLDGQPANIVVVTLSPPNRPGQHIQFLAEIGKSLGDAAVREKILSAPDADTVIAAICASVRPTSPGI